MPNLETTFSKRHCYTTQAKEITIREVAPENLRYFMLETARDLGITPYPLRDITCSVLHERPNPQNWSEYPNVWGEAEGHVYSCDWFRVYDIIEKIWKHLKAKDEVDDLSTQEQKAPIFERSLNEFFFEEGIGWQLANGQIVIRGEESFEALVKTAETVLEEAGRLTASKHIHEALADLSRRPEPDLPGAVYHAMGSLECFARDVTGDQTATLGEILKRHPGLVPRPLDTALAQMWGYASNTARHVQEGHEPESEEAELLVGLAATVAIYLNRKV